VKIPIAVGDSYAYEFSFSQEDVDAFVRLSGDNNHIHQDKAAAAASPMRVMGVPGLLTAMIFSRVLGTIFPGHGTVYRSQSLEFIYPVQLNQPYVAKFEVEGLEPVRHRARIKTTVEEKGSGRPCLLGTAVVQNPQVL
jgi:acyl dehydratase